MIAFVLNDRDLEPFLIICTKLRVNLVWVADPSTQKKKGGYILGFIWGLD